MRQKDSTGTLTSKEHNGHGRVRFKSWGRESESKMEGHSHGQFRVRVRDRVVVTIRFQLWECIRDWVRVKGRVTFKDRTKV